MSTYAIQAGALRTNPNSGPDGVGVQADVAYTLEARAEVQAVCAIGTPANDNVHPAPATTVAGEPLRFLSVCSGIEAASVAWKPLGWQAVAFSEIEKFPSAVLAHHYPDVPNLGDFTQIDTTTLGQVDILCGGTPCQAFSVAGLRQSLDDARGNLSLEFVRLAHELADGNGLRNVVWENVVGVLSTKDNAFGCFLGGLVGADTPIDPPTRGKWGSSGMVSGPKGRAAWRIVDAQYFGVAQRRRRVLVVADFGNGADPAQVLFELDGVQRHSAPSREARKDVAPTISARTKGGGGLGTDFDLDGGVIEAAQTWAIQERAVSLNLDAGPQGKGYQPDVAYTLEARNKVQSVAYAPEIARCDATREGSSQDYETTTMVVGVTGEIAHTLKAEGADASEDGTGRGTPIVTVLRGHSDYGPGVPSLRANGGDAGGGSEAIIAFSAKDYGGDASFNLSPTLRAGGHSGSHANAGVMPAVAMTVALRGREGGATAELGGEVATALRASSGGGDKPHVLAFTTEQTPKFNHDCALTLTKQSPTGGGQIQSVAICSAVRRLTPRECERLQGFQFLCAPDYPGAWQDDAGRWWSPDYTAIPWRGKPASECPDGPRYKALGNSWAVPKFVWLGRRLAAHMPVAAPIQKAA